ncbi:MULTISPECIES: hydrocarbon-binding protein [unclassified Anabaena]|uniref:hydrocarbon-binding protein n=1 Tax=unclassified Anabaena TaxID=2619674 RepID=UPI001446686D|nr:MULTISPECIES: hydrocarbon-binding protein [unclassified Anabaena]MTJ07311.1 hydrocarbon-binding protein [Anabaena sp. UHCC 0204]MTJ55142.1 hydrocarbon-binding protein [Anabaena sp. UHCC 0253]
MLELRKELGDFNSIICFKAAITGMEEALGEKATAIALTTAGRARGKKVAENLGFTKASHSLNDAANELNLALGKEGTRLCIVEKIVAEGEIIKVYTSETFCSAGEPLNSPRKCTFTMGAFWGAIEQILGKCLRGTHTKSVLQGGTHDVFELVPF